MKPLIIRMKSSPIGNAFTGTVCGIAGVRPGHRYSSLHAAYLDLWALRAKTQLNLTLETEDGEPARLISASGISRAMGDRNQDMTHFEEVILQRLQDLERQLEEAGVAKQDPNLIGAGLLLCYERDLGPRQLDLLLHYENMAGFLESVVEEVKQREANGDLAYPPSWNDKDVVVGIDPALPGEDRSVQVASPPSFNPSMVGGMRFQEPGPNQDGTFHPEARVIVSKNP